MSSTLRRTIWKFLVELQMCSILNNSAIPLQKYIPRTDSFLCAMILCKTITDCTLFPAVIGHSLRPAGGVRLLPHILCSRIMQCQENDNVGYLGGKTQSFHCLCSLRFLQCVTLKSTHILLKIVKIVLNDFDKTELTQSGGKDILPNIYTSRKIICKIISLFKAKIGLEI